MNASTTLSQIPHGTRFALIPSDFPTGTPGTLAYRQQLVNYFNRDEASADHYRHRPLRITSKDTVQSVYRHLYRVLCREGLIDEYMSLDYLMEYNKPEATIHREDLWESIGFRWVAVYPVTGGSEGVYVHVEFVGTKADWYANERKRHGFFMVKTWTWDNAWAITRRVVELLAI